MVLTLLGFPLQYAPSAGIAQLVEHNLAKVGVASSSLVSRSRMLKARFLTKPGFFLCGFQGSDYWGTVTGFPPSTSRRRI